MAAAAAVAAGAAAVAAAAAGVRVGLVLHRSWLEMVRGERAGTEAREVTRQQGEADMMALYTEAAQQLLHGRLPYHRCTQVSAQPRPHTAVAVPHGRVSRCLYTRQEIKGEVGNLLRWTPFAIATGLLRRVTYHTVATLHPKAHMAAMERDIHVDCRLTRSHLPEKLMNHIASCSKKHRRYACLWTC